MRKGREGVGDGTPHHLLAGITAKTQRLQEMMELRSSHGGGCGLAGYSQERESSGAGMDQASCRMNG